jgi:hypothetical protein
MRKFELYKVVEDPGKGLVLEKDSDGQYYIATLPRTIDNVFSSIEEVEKVIGYKLEFMEEEYVPDE